MFTSGLEFVIDIVAIGSVVVTIMVTLCTYHNSRKKARAEVVRELFSSYLFFTSIVDSNSEEIEKLVDEIGKQLNISVNGENALMLIGKNHIINQHVFDMLDAFEIKILAFCQANSDMTKSVLEDINKLRIWLQNTNFLYELLSDGKTNDYIELYKRIIYEKTGNRYQFSSKAVYEHMKNELKKVGVMKKRDPIKVEPNVVINYKDKNQNV